MDWLKRIFSGSLYDRARTLKEKGRPGDAAELLRSQLKPDPQQVSLKEMEDYLNCVALAAECLSDDGWPVEGCRFLRDILESKPDCPQELFDHLQSLTSRALRRLPPTAEARVVVEGCVGFLARRRLGEGKAETCVEFAREGLEYLPRSSRLWELVADGALEQGDLDVAADALKQAVAVDPPAVAHLLEPTRLLAQRAEASGKAACAAAAHELLGQACYRKGAWDDSLSHLKQALQHADALDDPTLLLKVYGRLGQVQEFADYALTLLANSPAPELVRAVAADTRLLLREHANVAGLALAMGLCQLRTRQYMEASRQLEQAVQLDAALAPRVWQCYQDAYADDRKDAAITLAMIRNRLDAGCEDEAWPLVVQASKLTLTREQRGELCRIAGDMVTSRPEDPVRHRILIRCLLEQDEVAEAFQAAWEQLDKVAAIGDEDVDLCVALLDKCRSAGGNDDRQASALRLAAEFSARVGRHAETVAYLRAVAALRGVGTEELSAARGLAESLTDQVPQEPAPRLVLAGLLTRLGRHDEATAQAGQVIVLSPTDAVLRQAAEQLEQLLADSTERAEPCAALAQACLALGDWERARPLVLECVAQHADRAPAILDSLKTVIATPEPPAAARTLLIDALVGMDGEPWLSQALDAAEQQLDNTPHAARHLREQVRRVATRADSQETQRRARLLEVRASLVLQDWEVLATACEAFPQDDPTCVTPLIDLLTEGLAVADGTERARLLMARGCVRAQSMTPEAALEDFRLAAEQGPASLLDLLIDCCRELAREQPRLTAAILIAVRTAIEMGHGVELLPDVLELLPRFPDAELPDVQTALCEFRAAFPECGLVLVAIARVCRRQGELSEAWNLYQQAIDLQDHALLQTVVEDLHAWSQEPDVVCTPAFLLAEALLASDDTDAARNVLVARAESAPDDAAACAERLGALADGPDAGWRERVAWGYVLCLAGKGAAALAAFREGLGAAEVDWCEVSAMAGQLRNRAEQQPGRAALHAAVLAIEVAVEVRSLPPEQWGPSMQRVRDFLGRKETPAKTVLGALLDDCGWVADRAPPEAEACRWAEQNRAHLLRRLGRMEEAAFALDGLLDRWPDLEPAVQAECEAAADAKEGDVFRLPAAAVCVLQEDFPAAIQHLRILLETAPQYAEAIARRAGQAAVAEARPEALLLQAEAFAESGEIAGCVAALQKVLAESPTYWERIAEALTGLLAESPDEPLIYRALVDLHAGRGLQGRDSARAVVSQWLDRGSEGNIPDEAVLDEAVSLFGTLQRAFPENLEVRSGLLTVRLRQGPDAYSAFATEAQRVCREFPATGPPAVLELLKPELQPESSQILLWYVQSQVQAELGQLEASVTSLRTIRQLASEQDLERLRIEAASMVRSTRHPAAILFLAELAIAVEDWEDAARNYASVLDLPERDLNVVQRGLDEILEQSPENATAWMAKGRCAALDQQPAAAAYCYRRAAAAGQADAVCVSLAVLCQDSPNVAEPWFALGEAQLRSGRAEEAVPALATAAACEELATEDRVLAYKYLAECYARVGSHPQAVEALSSACALAPDDLDAANRLLRAHLANLSDRVERRRAELSEHGSHPDRHWALGCALRDYGEDAEAMRQFQQLLGDAEYGGSSRLEIAKCQLRQQQCNLAIVNLRQVLAGPAEPEARREVLYHLGIAYTSLLLFDLAIEVLEELCAMDADYRDAAERLAVAYRHHVVDNEFLLAEVPFDLLQTWKQLAVQLPVPELPE